VATRSQIIRLPSGDIVRTPLLIPSVSSKGFDFIERQGHQISAASDYLDVVARDVNESLLLSAYDIRYGHLRQSDALFGAFNDSIFAYPKVLFIDSGGYEANTYAFDRSQTYHFAYRAREWNEAELSKMVDAFSPAVSGVLVNFDHYGPIKEQAGLANGYFAGRRRFIGDFLLKPQGQGDYLDWRRAAEAIDELRAFAIIGVTEKELGESIEDRLVTVACLRRALDEGGLNQPIHIFGSLDTLYTPLYFLAGAEIFDGLTWLRYAYNEGLTLYSDMLAILERHVTMRNDQRGARVHVGNLAYLRKLEQDMRTFVDSKDMGQFGAAAPVLEGVIRSLSQSTRELL
jgi:hypothetical protein